MAVHAPRNGFAWQRSRTYRVYHHFSYSMGMLWVYHIFKHTHYASLYAMVKEWCTYVVYGHRSRNGHPYNCCINPYEQIDDHPPIWIYHPILIVEVCWSCIFPCVSMSIPWNLLVSCSSLTPNTPNTKGQVLCWKSAHWHLEQTSGCGFSESTMVNQSPRRPHHSIVKSIPCNWNWFHSCMQWYFGFTIPNRDETKQARMDPPWQIHWSFKQRNHIEL